jgi:hypothetical protein
MGHPSEPAALPWFLHQNAGPWDLPKASGPWACRSSHNFDSRGDQLCWYRLIEIAPTSMPQEVPHWARNSSQRSVGNKPSRSRANERFLLSILIGRSGKNLKEFSTLASVRSQTGTRGPVHTDPPPGQSLSRGSAVDGHPADERAALAKNRCGSERGGATTPFGRSPSALNPLRGHRHRRTAPLQGQAGSGSKPWRSVPEPAGHGAPPAAYTQPGPA